MPLRHERLDGQALRGWRRDKRQIAQAAQSHVERARNRRRGQCEHMHFRTECFQALLVANTEAVLLVDDDQTEVFEAYMCMQQTMRRNDDIYRAALDAFDDGVAF